MRVRRVALFASLWRVVLIASGTLNSAHARPLSFSAPAAHHEGSFTILKRDLLQLVPGLPDVEDIPVDLPTEPAPEAPADPSPEVPADPVTPDEDPVTPDEEAPPVELADPAPTVTPTPDPETPVVEDPSPEVPAIDEDVPAVDEDVPAVDEDVPAVDEDVPAVDEDTPVTNPPPATPLAEDEPAPTPVTTVPTTAPSPTTPAPTPRTVTPAPAPRATAPAPAAPAPAPAPEPEIPPPPPPPPPPETAFAPTMADDAAPATPGTGFGDGPVTLAPLTGPSAIEGDDEDDVADQNFGQNTGQQVPPGSTDGDDEDDEDSNTARNVGIGAAAIVGLLALAYIAYKIFGKKKARAPGASEVDAQFNALAQSTGTIGGNQAPASQRSFHTNRSGARFTPPAAPIAESVWTQM
eukprot:jgi/Ulvmu1/6985/UM033_0043.1